MRYATTGDIHLQVQDPYSNLDSKMGLSIRTLDKLTSLDKALNIAKLQKVKAFFITGDIFDKMNPPERLKKAFYSILLPYLKFYDIYIIPGNHDGIQYAHSFMSEKALLDHYLIDNLYIIDSITLLEKYDEDILLIPWTTDLDSVKKALKENRDIETLCFGHLEIKGAVSTTDFPLGFGLYPESFSRFKAVFLSHYHKYQKVGKNIWYVGSPNIKDMSEIGIQKGFLIYDSIKKEHEFYQLEERMFFEYLISEDTVEEVANHLDSSPPPIGSVIKLVIKGSRIWVNSNYEMILEAFKEYEPLKLLKKTKIDKKISEDVSLIIAIKDRYDRIKEFSKDKPKNYTTYLIKILNSIEEEILEQ